MVNAFAVLLIGLFLLLSFRDVDRHTPVGRLVRHFIEKQAQSPDSTPSAEPGGTGSTPSAEAK
jgi:hypothetical protein